jgi:hypothetical protein
MAGPDPVSNLGSRQSADHSWLDFKKTAIARKIQNTHHGIYFLEIIKIFFSEEHWKK